MYRLRFCVSIKFGTNNKILFPNKKKKIDLPLTLMLRMRYAFRHGNTNTSNIFNTQQAAKPCYHTASRPCSQVKRAVYYSLENSLWRNKESGHRNGPAVLWFSSKKMIQPNNHSCHLRSRGGVSPADQPGFFIRNKEVSLVENPWK